VALKMLTTKQNRTPWDNLLKCKCGKFEGKVSSQLAQNKKLAVLKELSNI
jgi:hypothetical protein